MKTVFANCPKCPADAAKVRVYGEGVCAYHLAHPEDDQSKTKRKEAVKDVHEEELLKKFWKDRAAEMPGKCENGCGHWLPRGTAQTWVIKSSICHIVPKRHFKSVIIHPLNCWFGCQQCHHDYDDLGWSHAVTMPVWEICVERFKKFMDMIKDTELKHLPDALRILMPNPLA
jgi:hypothetical protein